MIQKLNPTLKEIAFQKGIIENYIDLDKKDNQWDIVLHEKAFEVDKEFISKL